MRRSIFLLAAACALLASTASAATYYYGSGDGPWDTSTQNWGTTTGGPYNTAYWADVTPTGNAAVFEGTAGTVTIPTGETRDVSGLTFGLTGYTITGGTLNLANGASPATMAVTGTGTISSLITGSYGFTMNNSAVSQSVALTNANTYSGVTTLTKGVIHLRNGDGLGAYGEGNHTYIGTSSARSRVDLLPPDMNVMTCREDFILTGTGSAGSGAIWARYQEGSSNTSVLTGDLDCSTTADTGIGAHYGTSTTFSGDVVIGGKFYIAGRGEGFFSSTGSLLPDSVSEFTGDISGAGQILEYSYNCENYSLDTAPTTITYKGMGTIVLSGNNSYTGITTIGTSSGAYHCTYVIKSDTALGSTSGATTVIARSALQLDGSGGDLSVAENITINGQGTPTFTGLAFYVHPTYPTATNYATYTSVVMDTGAIRNIAGDNTLSGNITLGSASRINSDQDTLTLSGAVSGNYALTIGGDGIVSLASTGTIASGTSVNVFSGATLAGSGTVNGATTVASGGYLMPGADGTAGTLTMANLTLDAGAMLAFDLGPTAASDKISMSGSTLTINGLDLTSFDFNVLPSAELGVYTLIDAGAISGSLGSNLSTSYMGYLVTLSIDGINNDVLLTVAVPEPSTLALLTCGLIGLLAYAWRKRK